MKTLYIECNMGAAGDMLMGALMELIPHKNEFISMMNSLGIPGIQVHNHQAVKCGITGNQVHVIVNGEEEGHEHSHDSLHNHHHGHLHGIGHEENCNHEHTHPHHHHSGLSDIKSLITGLDIPDKVKDDALSVYETIAAAESQVHGVTMDEIHFHEVGTLDAVTDVVGNCILMKMIGADRVVVSPVHVGSGQVKCAHGILPVPAPATALILEGVPIYSGNVKGELCTPTGAALLKHFANSFGNMPVMNVSKIGYGMGTKDFEEANCVRAMIGEEENGQIFGVAGGRDEIIELATNLDDMTAEEMGYAMEVLLDAGALDVYAEPIIMKKSRPAYRFTCLCRPLDKEKIGRLIFKHTTTIGIREYECSRMVLERREYMKDTEFGTIRFKSASGYDVEREKAEYEDLAKIASNNNMSISEVKKKIIK